MNNITLNISLPTLLVKKADEVANSKFATRSDLIREALWSYLKDQEEWANLLNFGQSIGKKMKIKSEKDVNKMFKSYRTQKNANQSRS